MPVSHKKSRTKEQSGNQQHILTNKIVRRMVDTMKRDICRGLAIAALGLLFMVPAFLSSAAIFRLIACIGLFVLFSAVSFIFLGDFPIRRDFNSLRIYFQREADMPSFRMGYWKVTEDSWMYKVVDDRPCADRINYNPVVYASISKSKYSGYLDEDSKSSVRLPRKLKPLTERELMKHSPGGGHSYYCLTTGLMCWLGGTKRRICSL